MGNEKKKKWRNGGPRGKGNMRLGPTVPRIEPSRCRKAEESRRSGGEQEDVAGLEECSRETTQGGEDRKLYGPDPPRGNQTHAAEARNPRDIGLGSLAEEASPKKRQSLKGRRSTIFGFWVRRLNSIQNCGGSCRTRVTLRRDSFSHPRMVSKQRPERTETGGWAAANRYYVGEAVAQGRC